MAKFNPLDHPICFSYPLRLAAMSEAAHVSFAMTIVDLLRPRTIVELGTTDGILYCAFCQAVRELRLDARCYGVSNGHFETDGNSKPSTSFADWRKAHDDLYTGFSQLLTEATDHPVELFDQDSVDLLHLNGSLSYESARNEFASWLPKLSRKSVVLLSDTNLHQGTPGTSKLWEELKSDYPHFEFGHASGLGLLAVGTDVPEEIRLLLTAREPEMSVMREFFRQQ